MGSETVTRIRSTAASSRHIQNTDTGHNRGQCSGQFIFAAIFSVSLSSPFSIQLLNLNWVRTNVAHLRLGINKQSVWREQESRIHFATQKKFNVNKQCIIALSTLQSPSLAHHNLFNSAGLLVDIVDKAEHNDGCCLNTTARGENVLVTCQLTDAEVTVYPSNLATMLLQLTSSP